MFRRFDFISGGMNKHSMIQRWTAIASIFIFTALIIAGCMKSASPQKQVTEVDPNVATEEVTLKVGGMV